MEGRSAEWMDGQMEKFFLNNKFSDIQSFFLWLCTMNNNINIINSIMY